MAYAIANYKCNLLTLHEEKQGQGCGLQSKRQQINVTANTATCRGLLPFQRNCFAGRQACFVSACLMRAGIPGPALGGRRLFNESWLSAIALP